MAGGLDELITEGPAPGGDDLDARSTIELVELMNAAHASVPGVVAEAAVELGILIDAVAQRLADGGRLIYAGAGTSGGLAELDAAECEATFSTVPGQVIALVAGSVSESPAARQAAEDDAAAGARDVRALEVSPADAVVGVSASGRTPYVAGALRAAADARALTACVVCTPGSELAGVVDHEISVVVGPEIVAGSTRLKAGTAQKLVLNTLSTVAMIRLGRTFGNQMVDVAATNDKLRARARRIVADATGAGRDEVDAALAAADGSAKVAIVCLLTGVDTDAARARLESVGGNLRLALEQ